MATNPFDLTRTVLAVLSIIGLIAVSLLVLQPFLAATVWAATLVIATWPLMLRLQSALGGRRGPAAALMTLVLLLLVLLPLSMAISAIMSNAGILLDLPAAASVARIPSPPSWLSDIPLVGHPAAEKWRNLADSSTGDIIQLVRPYVMSVTEWFLQAAGSFAQVLLHLLLTIGIAAIFMPRVKPRPRGVGALDGGSRTNVARTL